jgi:hypothetical protein
MEVTTYELTPEGIRKGPGVEMFNTMVNKWVRCKKEALAKKGVDISLFFNHDLETGKTIIGYTKVIYHYFDRRFYLTGVNEGAQAVQLLATAYNKPFEENGIVFAGFKPAESIKNEGVVYPVRFVPGKYTLKRLVFGFAEIAVNIFEHNKKR